MITRAEAKSYFETGDHPTQLEFSKLIDQIFDGDQEAMTVAETAADDAASALATCAQYASKCFGLLKTVGGGGGYSWATDNEVGCVITYAGVKNSTVTITFNTAMIDAKYTVFRFTSVGTGLVTLTSKAADKIVFTLSNAPGAGDTFEFVIFR